MFCQTKAFLALVTVIYLIQSFQWYAAKQKQPVYNNKVKMYVRLFVLFWRLFENYWWLFKSFYTAVSRHQWSLAFSNLPHTEVQCQISLESKPRKPAPASKPRCLLNLFFFFDTTVEKSLCIENRRLSFHRHFQLAHYVKISMHGHNWNVPCCLPCKSYVLFHGRRTPYFKYSVDKDLKIEDSYSIPLMV